MGRYVDRLRRLGRRRSCERAAVLVALLVLVCLAAPAAALSAPPAVTGLASPTHPDPSTAYPDPDPVFTWVRLAAGAAIAGYSLRARPDLGHCAGQHGRRDRRRVLRESRVWRGRVLPADRDRRLRQGWHRGHGGRERAPACRLRVPGDRGMGSSPSVSTQRALQPSTASSPRTSTDDGIVDLAPAAERKRSSASCSATVTARSSRASPRRPATASPAIHRPRRRRLQRRRQARSRRRSGRRVQRQRLRHRADRQG